MNLFKFFKGINLIGWFISLLFVYFVFFRDQFPKAWNEPKYSIALTGVFLFLAGLMYLSGIVLGKKEKALPPTLWILGFSAFYFIVWLVRAYILVRN